MRRGVRVCVLRAAAQRAETANPRVKGVKPVEVSRNRVRFGRNPPWVDGVPVLPTASGQEGGGGGKADRDWPMEGRHVAVPDLARIGTSR